MSRIVSVWLPRWPILRMLAAQAKRPADKPIAPDEPFVLTVAGSGGPRIAALNETAEAAGLAPGEPLADARAKAEFLQVRAVDTAADDAALRRLALWATRYTPTASPYDEDNGADGFFLDIEGAAHLFGGEAQLIADLAGRLQKLGLPARLAVASTPGAAWALSRFHAAACCGYTRGLASARFQNRGRPARQTARAVCRTISHGIAAPHRSGVGPRRRAARARGRTAGLSFPALSARTDRHAGRRRRAGPPPDADAYPCADAR